MDRICRQMLVFTVVVLVQIQVVQNQGACGRTDRVGPSGEISSPNYPDPYPRFSACKWHIKPGNNEVVTISFIFFDVENDTNCLSDSLEISDGGSKPIYVLCGHKLPTPYISGKDVSTVTVKFESDGIRQRNGFLLEYITGEQPATRLCDKDAEFRCGNGKCIPINWTCNGMDECGDKTDESMYVCHTATTSPPIPPITNPSGLTTQKHPPPSRVTTEYPCEEHHFYCISAASHQLTCFPEFQKCDGHKDCATGEDEEGCESVCSHYLQNNFGYFHSPNYPGHYDSNLDCFWVIIVSGNNVIQLRFKDFDLEIGYSTDYVSVYDGENEYTDKLGTFYATGFAPTNPHGPPTVIESSSNRMMVTLKTDAKSNDKGFNATFQTKGECIEGQQMCSADDQNCFSDRERCDGILTCMMGNDELGCGSCRPDQIPCSMEGSSSECYTTAQRCNGKTVCSKSEDEANCPVALCNSGKGLFLCGDKNCITENWICDGSSDCPDDSDEINCRMSTNVITAATVGSIICGLLLVAALSCTCKLYQLRVVDRHPPTHISPLREIEDELMRREAPPSYTATMSSPHFDQAQRAFIEGIQAAVIARQETNTTSTERPNRRRNNLMRLLSREGLQETAGLPVDSDPNAVPNTGDASNPETEGNTNESGATTSSQTDDRGNADGESTTESMQHTLNTENNSDGNSDIPMPVIPPNPTPSVEVNPTEATSEEGGPPSESNSCCTSDTDSDTNQEAFEIEQREQNIIRAAANIRRMRLAGGLQNVIEGAQRNGGTSPPPVDDQNENTNNSSHVSDAETLSDDVPLDLEVAPSQENVPSQSTNQEEHTALESTNQQTETNSTEASMGSEATGADQPMLISSNNPCSDDDVPLILTQPSTGTTNSNESQA